MAFVFFRFFFRFFPLFLKEEKICYKNGMLHFLFKLSQSLEIVLQSFKEFTRTKNELF